MSPESPPAASRARRLLVVDDESHQLEMLAGILSRAGYEVETASDGEQAIALLERARFDLLLTDQRMPQIDGLELLERARALEEGLPVVLMTAYGSVSNAVAAMKRGASDYLTKPFDKDELLLVLRKVLHQRLLEREVASLRGAFRQRERFGGLLGASAPMQELFGTLERVAHSDVAVLIRGESGTGKELAARALHAAGPRSGGPFVALNCAAVPEHLLESEFFGFERGAFTGAVKPHTGRFEQADGGTLFLDEIGAMRIELQAKLLRVLEEGQVQRLGAHSSRRVDVRILAASCEDLEEAIRERRFREDLYYRINVVSVELPPLRERPEDVPLLVEHFLARAAQRLNRPLPVCSARLLDRLSAYGWPGNVRELENCIERMMILSGSARLEEDHLPKAVRRPSESAASAASRFALPAEGVRLGDVEKALIVQAMRRARGALGPAAALLGISYKTLQYRLRKHALERADFETE
ncbi:MAG: sigma-54-dependent Fis family transcriptional regulator [Acidobacteriota bacterium]|nr:MAG: sigma-54-dependent Fis family transcriptional regulator [Acidobacteriota bacterium]